MVIRVDRGKVPAEKVKAFVSLMRDRVVPELRTLPGYRSTSVATDPSTGRLSVTTAWATVADRDACDPVLAEVLRNAARLELEPIEIEFYEIALADSMAG